MAPFTVFQSAGMLMARPVPVTLSSDQETQIAREGYVSLIAIPRTSESGSFEKDKKVAVKLRAKQIGQLIAWRGLLPSTGLARNNQALTLTAYSGSVPVSLDFKPPSNSSDQTAEPMVEISLTPKEGERLIVPISVGEMKALQVLLESALPALYGWTFKNLTPKSTLNASEKQQTKSPEEFFKQFSSNA